MKRKEYWKDVVGFEGLYKISNYGKVKALEKQRISGRGGLYTYPQRILKPSTTNRGYLLVTLQYYSTPYYKLVHRLVAEAFIPNPKKLPEVNHLKGKKKDNRSWMLEWTTRSQNAKHAVRTGLMCGAKGELSGTAKLTDKKVKRIRYLYKHSPLTQKEIAKLFDVSIQHVSDLINNKRWNHI
jgi:hypothetical protein